MANTGKTLARVLRAAHRPIDDIDQDKLISPQLTTVACEAWLGGLVLEAVERHRWSVALPQLRRLRWQASRIDRTNRHILQCLSRAAFAFRECEVEVLLLKGAALNFTLYKRLHLRPMSDLDLLVGPEDASRAMLALEQSGFRRGVGLVRKDFFPRFHYATEYRSDHAHSVRIDLHVRPFRPLRYAQTIPDEAFWHRAQVVDVGGVSARVADAEEQFVHLATHSAIHGHSRLLWLYDLCRLVDLSGDDLDWDRIVAMSRRLSLVLPVRETLQKLQMHWGPLAPDDIREAMNAERVGWRDRLCLAQAPQDAVRPIRHAAVNLLCMRGIRFRLGYLRCVLWPDRGHMGQVYHRRHRGWLLFAHLRRWLRPLFRPVLRSYSLLRSSA
ncbi:MAG: nucleotidyltransferase domain-containing protein [Planctomycetota bacterium]